MLKNCCTFLKDANKSVSEKLKIAFVLGILLAGNLAWAEDPSPSPTSGLTAGPTPDLTQIPVTQLQEVQKNSTGSNQIGDRINLLAEIKTPGLENGEHLALKLPEGSSKLEDQGWYIDPSNQFLTGTFRFIVSPIQTGTLILPTLLIVKDDQTVVGRTSPFTVKVAELDKKEQAKPELLDIATSSLPAKYWVLIALVSIALMVLISYWIYRYQKFKRKKPPLLPKVRNDADHVLALRKIEALYQKYPYEVENLKPVAFGVSETLKEFFSKRFKIDASEATTDEMLALLRKESVSNDNLREIQNLFLDLDLVKFTKSEHYRNFDEGKYSDFKLKAQLIVQKWAVHPHSEGPTV